MLVVLSAVLAAGAIAQGDSAARKAIQSRYDDYNRAYMKKDFKKVGEMFSSDCVFFLGGEGRSMKASRALKGMEAMAGSLTIKNAKTRIVSIVAKGEQYEVVAAWSGHSNYVSSIKGSKEDPPRQADSKQAYRDTWKKTDKGWQIVGRIIGQDVDDVKPPAPPKTPAAPKVPEPRK